MLEYILKMAKRVAESAEVFLITSEETPVEFEANNLKHIQRKQSQIVALRIINKGRIGYSVTNNLDDIDNLIDASLATAEFGMPARFDFPTTLSHPEVKIYDKETASVSLEHMVRLGERMITTVKKHNKDIICEASILKNLISVKIINSNGKSAGYSKSVFSLGIEGNLIRGTDMLFVAENLNSCHPLDSTRNITDTIIRQLEWADEQATVSSKILPIIFTPSGVASALMNPLMVAFNGKTVLEGASPIGNLLGEQVFDSKLNLYDDATIDYRPSSHPFDDEGVEGQRIPLIEAGTPINFIYDLQTAALAGKDSTGNGKRHGGGLPSPSPNAFVVSSGDVPFNDMLADLKNGLVIEYLMGAEQGNILGGDFSGNILLGYKVENGKIKGRVKDTMVSGNVYQLLKEIAAIGNDSKWVDSIINTPSLYCPGISVSVKN
ncbi:MAG: TldD/PmbA family protein [Dehalococcoidia bacterium]|nr:MAG: TldD/PmbA family protein [Dehalococcoidia bacterium]